MTSNRRIRVALWALALWAAVVPFVHLGHPLWEVDDARYAEVPREMLERGDWLTPRLDYMDYVEKPPLPYWATCLSYRAFGMSERSAHFPLALWTLLALAAVGWMGSWLFGLETGLAAAAMLGTSIAFLSLSHLATPDMPLTAALAWTAAFWLRAMRHPDDAVWAGAAAGACMGAAVLCKGLVGVVFPVLWTAALAALEPGLRPGYRRSLLSPLVPAFLLVAAPWFVLMQRRHPGFLAFFFGEQHFQRFLSGAAKYRRPGPFWYFFPVGAAGALPWTPLAAVALWSVGRGWKASDGGPKALALWVAGVFAFFTVSSSKLPTYILPLFPQLCLLSAAHLLGPAPDRRDRAIRGLSLGLGLALVLCVPLVPLALGRIEGAPLPGDVPWYGGAALGLLALATLGLCLEPAWLRIAAPCVGAGLAGCLALASARSAEAWVSARPLALAIAAEAKPGDRVLSYGVYLHGISFYTGLSVDPVNWVGELHYGRRDPANAARFGDDNTIRRLPGGAHVTFVALRKKEAKWLTSLNAPAHLGEMRTFGPWALAKFPASPRRPRTGGKSE